MTTRTDKIAIDVRADMDTGLVVFDMIWDGEHLPTPMTAKNARSLADLLEKAAEVIEDELPNHP